MAEFALGLAKTAVAGTVSRVRSAIQEEATLRVRVQDDLVFISGEFEMMQSFLSASGTGERASKNQVVRTWVRQLRGLAFEVEDCVEFIIHLEKPSRWDSVRRLTSSIRACMGKPPLPLDVAVAEIKRLKARVEDISARNGRYNIITSSDARGDDNNDDSIHQLLTQTAVGGTSLLAAEATISVLKKAWENTGMLHSTGSIIIELRKLIECPCHELQVISLWGGAQADIYGELGWRDLVKRAYDDPDTRREFKNRAWIKPTHPFNPVEFLNTMLTHFTSHLHHHPHDDMSQLVLQVSQHKYLLVLEEELSSVADWGAIRLCLLDGNNGSRIVVSTRHLGIALACTREPYQVWEQRRFFRDQYLYAFSPKIHVHGCDQQDHPEHADQGENINNDSKFKLGELVGRGNEELALYMPEAPIRVTMSVWGIAGVGKSALVQENYYSCKTKTQRYYNRLYGWVDVPNPFNLTDLCRRLLLDFYSDDVEAMKAAAISLMEGRDPTQWCSEIMHRGGFVIVLDGLQSKQDWDLIEATLLRNAIHCKTVVITREESIAKHCANREGDSIHNLKGLEADLALKLFRKISCLGTELPAHSTEILNLIISKCGGLPEIITAIADDYRFARASKRDELDSLNACFMGILQRKSGLRGLLSWMQSYFDACPDELKPCIFYMSVFHVDQNFRRRRLLRRWIAEGYSSGVGGTAEEKAEDILSELMKLSIVYQEKQTYKVNGFFLEYIKSRPMEDNLVFALEGICSPSSRLTGQHLTVSSTWERDEVVFNNLDLSRLRSVTVSGEWRSFLVSGKMKLLRVIDLEGTTGVTDDDLEKMVKLWSRIKFLSLRGCLLITRLPDPLADMRQLETLDAKNTSIVELPPAIITKLHKLQYIRAGTRTNTSLLLRQTKTLAPQRPPQDEEDVNGDARNITEASSMVHLVSTRITKSWKRKARDLVISNHNTWWKLKNQKNLCRRHCVAANGGGVELVHAAAKGIGRLTNLHTLGAVNVAGGKGGLLFLKELKKLTQLRKLGLSGIHRRNWHKLCHAISGNLHHLESLSLQLVLLEEGGRFEFALFDNIREPPKTLKHLKVLYSANAPQAAGGAWIRLVWIKKLRDLKRFDHELMISTPEDIDQLANGLPPGVGGGRFRVKPVEEDLSFDPYNSGAPVHYLRIECSSTLSSSKVTLDRNMLYDTKAISVHCCCSSSAGTSVGSSSSCNLKIIGISRLYSLNEVTVTGTYADDIREDLRKQLEHGHNECVRLF